MKENIAESLLPLCVDIASVKTDKKNNRSHNVRNLEALTKSLEAYGQRKPIVVNSETKVIEAGNGLYMAAFKLGWAKIAAVMVKDDPNTAKGYAIMDNQSGALSEWDLPNLSALLNELKIDEYNLDLTGFNSDELEELLNPGGQEILNKEQAHKTLAERFIVPPFSVLDARQGYWQERKRAWLALGIQSELGRGGNTLDLSASATLHPITDPAEREKWNASRRKNGGGNLLGFSKTVLNSVTVGTNHNVL